MKSAARNKMETVLPKKIDLNLRKKILECQI